MIDYYNKYLKYKTKYLELKNNEMIGANKKVLNNNTLQNITKDNFYYIIESNLEKDNIAYNSYMKKYKISSINQFGGNNFLKIREDINNFNVLNLKICKREYQNSNYIKKIDNGAQADILLLKTKKCGSIIIKKFYSEKIKDFNIGMKKELNGLIKIKNLITKNICPHYIYMYEYNKKENIIFLEYTDGNLKKLYKNFSIALSDEFIYSFFFQILYGIQCQYEYYNLLHHDLLPNNILKKTIDEDKVFVYTINDKKYYIPSMGNLFLISDYGACFEAKTDINYDFHDFMTGIISLFAKQLILKGYDTLEKFYEIIDEKTLKSNNIDLTLKLRILITKCIKKNLFNYKVFFENYNILDIALEIIKYKNIIDVFENIYKIYNKKIISEKLINLEPVKFIK